METRKYKPTGVTMMLDKLLRGDVGDSIDVPCPSEPEDAEKLRRALLAYARYRKVRVNVSGLGKRWCKSLKVFYLGVLDELRVVARSNGHEFESVVNITLAIPAGQWERLVKMAAHTGCEAAFDENGNLVEGMKADTALTFASELLETSILEMWVDRGYAAEERAKREAAAAELEVA